VRAKQVSSAANRGTWLADSWPALLAGLFPVLFVPLAVDAYILPRVLLLLVGGAVGLTICLAGRGPELGTLGALRLPAIAVCLAALLALVASVSFWASLAGEYLRYESAVVRIGYVLLFSLCVWLLTREASRRRVVTWFLVATSIASVEAVWEWVASRYDLIGALARPDGNLGNAGLLGALTAMAVPLLLGRLLQRGGLRWAPALALILAGLAASSSRSAWVGALLASLFVIGLRLPRRMLIAAAVAGAVLVAIAGLVVLAGPLRSLNGDPYTLRLSLWARTLPMILARPLFGWGEDTFGLVFGRYAGGLLPGISFDRAHSQPLDLAASQGLVGIAAATWFWAAFLLRMIRERQWRVEERIPLLGALLAYWTWAVVNFDWVPATAMFWLLAGVCWSAGSDPLEAAEGRRGLPRLLALVASGVALAVAMVFGVLPLAADMAYYADLPAQAVFLDPLQARYHRALGERLVGQGKVAAGAAELGTAGRLGDDDAATWVELGDAEQKLGNAPAARAAYAQARLIDSSTKTP